MTRRTRVFSCLHKCQHTAVDAVYLRTEDVLRVFDNLFSNLRKYADPACPVDIRAELDPETVRLELENRILTAAGLDA